MKIRKLLFLCLLVFLLHIPAYADVFERLANQKKEALSTSIESDSSGFTYRSGVDYNLNVEPNDPQIYLAQSSSLGCSEFDFASSFRNLFSANVMEDYVSSMASEVMAAAPMLLLEYVSPTLADVVKHFNSLTNLKLGLRYAQCEDIEKAVSDKMSKLRKKSEMECIKSKPYDDLDRAIRECKNQSDPFAFLKDSAGIPLGLGGQINILKDALKRIGASEEDEEFAEETIPETVIKKDGVKQVKEKKAIKQVLAENREQFFEDLTGLMAQYLETRAVSREDLNKFSVPGVPLTELQLKNIALLDSSVRQVALAKLSSELAYWKTLSQFEKNIELLEKTLQDPSITDDTFKDLLREKYKFIKEKIELIKKEREFLNEYNSVMATILEEADRERLKTLIIQDGSDEFNAQEEKEELRSGFLIPPRGR